MSSSRSIAAARQRRGVESAPPIKNNSYASNSAGKDNFNNNQQQRPNYRTTKSNIYQDNNATSNMNNNANQVSKLSVSDAFALVTLRLGRVELIMNKLQSEGILDANNNIASENLGNNNNFDDTILQNIITRLDGLDKKTVSNDLNQKLQSQYNVLTEDVKQTKEVVLKLQSFIMDISQKLNNFITTQENINEEFFDLRDDFHSSVINDVTNTISENDTNQSTENVDAGDVAITAENEENAQTVDNKESNSKNIDSLIANNLDNFTENTTNTENTTTATEEEVTATTEIPKNKQKNNKNKSMNVNV